MYQLYNSLDCEGSHRSKSVRSEKGGNRKTVPQLRGMSVASVNGRATLGVLLGRNCLSFTVRRKQWLLGLI